MKIVQISDTHLTAAGGPTEDAFRLLSRHLNDEVRPDLVVHSGDIQVLDPDDAADRAHSRELLELIDAPLLVIPGNHDVGMPGMNAWAGISVTDQRVGAHVAAFGPDHWRHDADEAVLLGINSELLGSGLQLEADQWRWLEQTFGDLPEGRPVLLFLHKPLWSVTDEPVDHQVDVGPVARDRLLGLVDGVDLRAVGCGHLHRYRQVQRGRTIEVWAPATAFLASVDGELPDSRQELGYVEYTVAGDAVSAKFRLVPGMPQLTVDDVPEIAKAIETMTAAL
ncbi:MAG: metallophosphoesterase [Gordonia polyisoprenivorans]|uniref:metallophosphoesterase family protein n=1 Tax=Gordonia polyisoprenivorans TaxID=84595 RepID=UPI00035C47F1|nr:metallophosphoesterase [Gordonia polyisoprenivorans]MBE7195370.1 metallophosphoesterase [Gordonia polyisoprenivorans]